MDRPTAAEIRAIVPAAFDWATFGYPAAVPDPLDGRVQYAAARLRLETGRPLDSITDPDEQAIAEHAIALLVMQETLGGGAAALTVMEQPWLRSFTAGSYSEERFSPRDLVVGGDGKDVMGAVNAWPALARDLWLLATPEQREAWIELASGDPAPAGGIFEVAVDGDWEGVWPYGARGWAS